MADLLDDTRAARRRRKGIVLFLAALAIILLIAAIVWWTNLPNEDDTTLGGEPTATGPTVLTAAELFAAYEDDPALTDLENQPVLVTATLATALDTGTTVLLSTADPLLSIAADLDPTTATQLTDAEAGAEVVLLCEGVTPGPRAPSLEGCTLG